MTRSFRYWLADLISGGELTRAREMEGYANKHMIDGYYGLRSAVNRLREEKADFHVSNGQSLQRIARQNIALRTIAAMETPKANATVKRMARTAREAVK